MAAVCLTIMTAKQTKPKKKPMTLDAFALLIQKDLVRMATKDDLKVIREEMATKKDLERFATKEDLDTAFSTLSDRIAIAKEGLQEQIAGLKYAKEIDELRARVNTLEHKVGIRPTHRGA
jgi:pyridoxine 5'-phosphate synthase PdxJ